jgi:hypothetical protein
MRPRANILRSAVGTVLALALCGAARDPGLHVRVDLERFELVAVDARRPDVALVLPVATGSPEHPSPAGRYAPHESCATPAGSRPAGARGAPSGGLSDHTPMGVARFRSRGTASPCTADQPDRGQSVAGCGSPDPDTPRSPRLARPGRALAPARSPPNGRSARRCVVRLHSKCAECRNDAGLADIGAPAASLNHSVTGARAVASVQSGAGELFLYAPFAWIWTLALPLHFSPRAMPAPSTSSSTGRAASGSTPPRPRTPRPRACRS